MRIKMKELWVSSQTHTQDNTPCRKHQTQLLLSEHTNTPHHMLAVTDLGSALSCVSQTLTWHSSSKLALSCLQTLDSKGWKQSDGQAPLPQQPVQRLLMWQEVNTDQEDCTSLLPLQKLFILTQWAKDKAWQYLLPSDITALNIKHLPQMYSDSYIDYKMDKAEMRYN